MDDRLEELMQNLGNAINDSLSKSKAIAAAIKAIKETGYDVFLVLEATIAFRKKNEQLPNESGTADAGNVWASNPARVKFRLTNKDKKFLKDMHIIIPEDDESNNDKEKK